MSATRPDRAVLLLAIALGAAIFAISFGFVADADRGAPRATAAPGAPRHEPASHAATAPRVALGAARTLRVRPSLFARPVHRAPARRGARRITPARAPVQPLPSAPSTDVSAQPVSPSTPVGAAPPSPTPTPSPAPAPSPSPPQPAPRPVAKPHPKPVAKPKPPKPPDFDNTGPPAPGTGGAGGR